MTLLLTLLAGVFLICVWIGGLFGLCGILIEGWIFCWRSRGRYALVKKCGGAGVTYWVYKRSRLFPVYRPSEFSTGYHSLADAQEDLAWRTRTDANTIQTQTTLL